MNDVQEENIIIYCDENGKQKKAYKLFSFEHNNINYMVFTEGNKNNKGEYILNACIYDPSGIDLSFYPIKSDYEWKMIREVYKNVKKYVDELLEKRMKDAE